MKQRHLSADYTYAKKEKFPFSELGGEKKNIPKPNKSLDTVINVGLFGFQQSITIVPRVPVRLQQEEQNMKVNSFLT